MKCIIVIPIYKSIPDFNEIISLKQCIKVLFKYTISIVTYRKLDISYYTDLLKKTGITYSVVFFDKSFFENIDGYNRLLLSTKFYTCFNKYKYMLIYQLDAYVFSDELDYWCNQGYDYIGAPWFDGWHETKIDSQIIGVGNGGFSLRRTNKVLILIYKMKFFNKFFNVFFWILKLFPILRNIKKIIKIAGFLIKNNPEQKNEDYQIMILSGIYKNFKIAPANIALSFSFDANPTNLFEMNNNQLPFGCHAWMRYEKDFWSSFIKKDNLNLQE